MRCVSQKTINDKEINAMNIRTMIIEDYPSVDRLMHQLHKIHVEGRPDLYVDMEHPYSKATPHRTE